MIAIPDMARILLPFATVAVSALASAHVLLHKRDTRAAIGWIGLIWLSPILGTVIYILLGINRIRRRARSLRRDQPRISSPVVDPVLPEALPRSLGPEGQHLESLARLVGQLTGRPLLGGNRVELLPGGEVAYPAMIEAIEQATRSVALATYIFNDDPAGRTFVEVLGRAVRRGVEVRVLIDDLGARYDLPTVFGPLRHAGVPVARFLPTLVPWFFPYLNLRNHRKILVVDGQTGFTGGMNIDKDFDARLHTRHPKQDLHFRVLGPVVADLMRAFADDWVFATDELLGGDAWFPPLGPAGSLPARGITGGPDQESEALLLTLLGAVSVAQRSIAIATPYFLPDSVLISALHVAALRGAQVDILQPVRNNYLTVQWANTALLEQVLEAGCRVWLSPPPFDHSKLMVIDRAWSLIGSSNWDARSLRLNFEFNLECHDVDLARRLDDLFQAKLRAAAPVSLDAIRGRGLAVKLRDGLAGLLSPYL